VGEAKKPTSSKYIPVRIVDDRYRELEVLCKAIDASKRHD